jgi:uncharacterized repeat protein (TIGR01451 family)
MDNNYTAVAYFDPIICYQVERLANPFEGGSVSVSASTPENCSVGSGWTPGSPVILEASENLGYDFVDWTDSDGTYTGSTNNPLIIGNGQLTNDRTLTANYSFTPDCYDIAVTINPPNEGQVIFSPERGSTCPGGWLNGTDVTITAEANEPLAYDFDSWGGDAAPLGSAPSGNLFVDANKNIVANFVQSAVVADLFIQKGDSQDPASVGQEFSYILVVGNNGPDDATGVSVTDVLPPSLTPISATPAQGSCPIGGNIVNCTIGFIPANTSITINIVVVPNNVGTIQNTATVNNTEPGEFDTNSSNNSDLESTQILPDADVGVKKTATPTANVGGSITYNIVVSNTRQSNAANVVVVDSLPPLVSYLSHTTTQGNCSHSGTQVTCNLGNVLANATPVNITIVAVANTQGTAVNQVNANSSTTPDTNTGNNTSTAQTVIGLGSTPFITINPTCASPNGTITVKGFNWPITPGNPNTNLYWDTTSGPLLGFVTNDSIVGGEWTTTVTIPPTASNGLHTIVARRTQGGSSGGTTIANATVSIPCPAADLIISPQITMITPGPVNQGDPVSFRVTITNTGLSTAVSRFPVSIYFNPDPAPIASTTHISTAFKGGSASVSGLGVNVGRVVTITAPAGFPISGTNSIYAVVDSDDAPDGVVDEINETNNISGPLSVNVLACDTNCSSGPNNGTGILAGQVFVPSISGELLPQSNVAVELVGPTADDHDFTFTNSNGTYVFSNLVTGSYTVSGCISIDGISYFVDVPVSITDGLITQQDLILQQGPCA